MLIKHWLMICCIITVWTVFGCSSTEVESLPPLPKVPKYTTVPHPNGYFLSDLKAIFNHPEAPTMAALENCDQKIRALKTKTSSVDEIKRGARELVADDPIFYHWCTYSRIIKLHEDVDKTDSLKTRQNLVINAYETITLFANAYRKEYQDTRYYRWAVKDYRRMSRAVFYRSLALTPEATVLVVDSMPSPHALWRKDDRASRQSVLEKYGLMERKANTEALDDVDLDDGEDLFEDADTVQNEEPLSAPADREVAASDDELFEDENEISLEDDDSEGEDEFLDDDSLELEDF